MGSGMATIRDPNAIRLGEFHTVELFRNHTTGYIVVDGGEPVNGSSQVRPRRGLTPPCPAHEHTSALPRESSRGWI